MKGAELDLPAGFRFHPTDDELVNHYLFRKCASLPIGVPIIAEIDLYKFDPWQLPEMAVYGEKEWYFFSPRDRKYPNGSRPNRAAGSGYWKATGADKPIGKGKPLGIKKALVFYAGKAPKGIKTNWIMHEYRPTNVDRSPNPNNNNQRLDDWVLCRIYNKKGKIETHLPAAIDHIDAGIEEDQKPQIHNYGQMMKNEPFHMDTSQESSLPQLHSDSSWSPPGEVQSQPNWNGNMNVNDLQYQFNNYYMDNFQDDPFASMEMDPLQDLFMLLQ